MKENRRTWFLIVLTVLIIIFGGLTRLKAQSPGEVFKMCQEIGIEHSDIVTKQSILETGWYECSDCSLDHNNIFGFRWKGEYLTFGSWERSVYYYRWWQRKHYSGGDYFEFLESIGYATSETYIQKVKSIEL